MDKEFELPSILLLWNYVFPSLRIAVLDLLKSLVVELITAAGISLGKEEEQIRTDHEAENVSMLELETSVSLM